MVQFRLYFDKDKETKWLNEMADQGWAMKSFFAGFYTFEECEKGQYQYQVDFCDQFLNVSSNYKEFMQDNDVEIVQQWGFWVILRKLSSKGEFVLYTDVDSQITHYTKILRMFQGVTLLEFLILLYEAYTASTTDNLLAWAFVFLIMAIVIVFINCIVNTRNIISELNERKTGIKEVKKNNVSVLLMIGFLFNACALIIENEAFPGMKLMIQVAAIVFMLSGIYDTLRNGVKRSSKQA